MILVVKATRTMTDKFVIYIDYNSFCKTMFAVFLFANDFAKSFEIDNIILIVQ